MLNLSNNNLKTQAQASRKRSVMLRTGLGLQLQSFTVAQLAGNLAAAKWPGAIVYCSNGAAGSPCLAYSNGTAWKQVAIGSTIAAS